MTVKEMAFALEQVEIKAWVLSSLALAVNDAIIEGPNSANNFDGALHMVCELTKEMDDELKKISKDAFEIMRKEKKEDMQNAKNS